MPATETNFYCKKCNKDFPKKQIIVMKVAGERKELYKCTKCGTLDIFPYKGKKELIKTLKLLNRKLG